MKKKFIVFILPVVFAYSCKTTKKTSADNSSNTEVIAAESFKKPVKDKELFKTMKDAVLLDTVFLSKDTLNIYTKKIQGCDADNFTLIWNGDLGKSLPSQASVKLFQLVDAACREKHRFHLAYNISNLKLKADTSASKMTIVHVGGWARVDTFSHN